MSREQIEQNFLALKSAMYKAADALQRASDGCGDPDALDDSLEYVEAQLLRVNDASIDALKRCGQVRVIRPDGPDEILPPV
jgi:hypothetical protein